MNQRIIAIAIFVVILIGGLIWLSGRSNQPTAINEPGITDGTTSPTKSPVPVGTVVPGTSDTVSPDVALPLTVTPSAAGAKTNFRAFDLKIDKGLFSPSTVIAYTNDVLNIKFTAVDKDYDVHFPDNNMIQNIKKGETRSLDFQANFGEGKFAFYCESCGGLNSKAVGYVIAVNPEE